MSEIRATTISDAAGTGPIALTKQSAAKVWVNFDQYYTNTIRDSYNVSSCVDGGTGILTTNFTNNMANASYSTSSACGDAGSYRALFSFDVGIANILAASLKGIMRQCDAPTTSLDVSMAMLHIHGDLA